MQELKVEKLGENFSEFQYIISESRANAIYSKYLEKHNIKKIVYPIYITLDDDNGVQWELEIFRAITQKNFSVKLFCKLVTHNPKDFFAYHVWSEKPKLKEEELSEVMQEYKDTMNELWGIGSQTEEYIMKITESLRTLLITKNLRYGDAAVNPHKIFSKHSGSDGIKIRIDDKISRIENSDELRRNDVVDLMGYLVLLCVANGWTDFNDLID